MSSRPQRSPLPAAILTGQAAGLIMAVVIILVFMVFLGKAPLYPVQVIGSAWFGEAALQGTNISAVLAGLLLHQAGPSLLWGILFGMLVPFFHIETTKEALLLGSLIGIISMLGPFLLIPQLFLARHGIDLWTREVPLFWDWAAHLVFGLSFALYPSIREKLG
jgi:hypothetical protein